jgi:hypothetical protein
VDGKGKRELTKKKKEKNKYFKDEKTALKFLELDYALYQSQG